MALKKPIQWCRSITNAGYATVAVIISAHVIWYFAARRILAYPPGVYLKNYIVFPGIGLFLVNLITDWLIRRQVPLILKEYAVLILFVIFSFYLSFTHKIASVLLGSFILPVFASAIFSNIKITRRIFILSNPCLLISGIHSYFSYDFDSRILMELFVAWDMLLCSYLLAKTLIRYGQDNLLLLVQAYHQQKRMRERLKLDPYTNLFNKKTFDDDLPVLYEKCKRSNLVLSLAIVDIDNFKRINDLYGHMAGDRVLLHLTRIFKNNETENMKIFRIGGEEFALVFIDCRVEDAFDLCEKMRSAMELSVMPDIDENGVTFSCGLAWTDRWCSHPDDLIKAADAALYLAKDRGRNRVVIYDGFSERVEEN